MTDATAAVAKNFTAGSEATRADITLRPSLVPKCQSPGLAVPSVAVVAVVDWSDPPPESTANVTVTPATPSPAASFTETDGLPVSTAPGSACWPLPACTARTDGTVPPGGGGGGVPGGSVGEPPQPASRIRIRAD